MGLGLVGNPRRRICNVYHTILYYYIIDMPCEPYCPYGTYFYSFLGCERGGSLTLTGCGTVPVTIK